MSGGKTQTSTQQVSIPPEVMARYRAVNQRAETVAAQPFQAYSYDPNAFVAPMTATQQAGIQNINQAAGMTQPFFQTAAGLTLGGAQGVGPLTQQQIGYYQNPFTQSVVGSTLAGLQQQQGQQLAQQQANAIKSGAFGGDRAGIERATLQGQQNLATAQAIAPLYQQGYQQAVQTAMGQQGVLASDLQRQLAAGQQLGALGAGAQQAALAGAQAQLGAGTAEQQTQQAGLQALYNQFLQERGYPFQVAQFLANIAMGTGALSGSTTTSTQPAPFFSDERNKKNVRVLGKDPDTGLNVIAYDDADDLRRARETGEPMPPKRVSYSAQEIEKRAPGLVGEVGGNKVVGMADGGAPPFTLRAPVMGVVPAGDRPSGGVAGGAPAFIPIQPSAYAPPRAPQATGFSVGTPIAPPVVAGGRRTPVGKGSVSSRSYMPDSQGGMVYGPGAYASGGSVVGSDDLKAILAAIGSPLEFYGGKGIYGGAAKGGAGAPGYVPAAQVAQPKLVTAGPMPRAPESGLSQATQVGSQIAGLAKAGQRALVGEEGVGGKKGSTGLIGSGGEINRQGYVSGLGGGQPSPTEPMRLASAPAADIESTRNIALDTDQLGSLFAARGGLIRHHYDLGGALPYSTEEMGKDPLQDIGEDDNQKYEMLKPTPPPSSGGDSGLGTALGLAKLGATIFSMSDERMKDNIERVGELYDGQPIYRYNFPGSKQTQLGLLAQDVERNGHRDAVSGLGGIKMVDYKRATDVAAGLAPRSGAYRGGYQDGGMPDEEPIILAALPEIVEQPRQPGLAPAMVMSDAEPIELPQVREPGLVVARRTVDEPGTEPVRSDEMPAGVVPTLPPVRTVGLAPGMREPAPGVAPTAETGTETGAPPRLLRGESGLSFTAVNPDTGAGGRAQFMASRLEDAKRAGVIPPDMTMTQFLNDRDAQVRTERWHFGDIRNFISRNDLGQYVGTTINGIPVTADGLVNVAHLGGSAGLKRFLETGGRYNPADANGTRLSDYLAMGASTTGATPAPGLAGGAPTRVTPGVAGPGRGPMDPASAPFYTLTQRALGPGDSDVRKALTSENFWVPALAGIGSMLASRSPFLGVALGEGLQGGTKAYTDLQAQQQQMGESKARTEQIMAGISGGALQVVDGRLMVRYLRPDGRYDFIEYNTIRSMSPADRAKYRIDPRDLEQAEKLVGGTAASASPAVSPPRVAAPGPTTTAPEPEAPTAPVAADRRMPHEVAPPASPVSRPTTVGGIGLTPEQIRQARAVTQERAGFPQAEREKQPDLFAPQYEIARQSETARGQVIPLVGALAALPRDKSIMASGPVQAVAAPIAGVVNNLASILGVQLPFDIANPRAFQEEIDKLGTRLNLQSASSAQQRAFAALQEISKSIPTYLNSPGGQAKLIPQLLIETQREIDRQNFFRAWENAAAGERGQNAEYARLSSRDANEAFEKDFNPAVYSDERKALEKMFNERFPITDPKTNQRRDISAMEYIVEFGGSMTPEQKQRFRERFGTGLKYDPLRYFGVN